MGNTSRSRKTTQIILLKAITFIIIIMRLLLICAVMALAKGSPCPEGWSKFHTACYKYIPEKLNWATAEKNCLGQCANLASVMSSAEDLFIRKLIKSKSGSNGVTWIGAHD